MHLIYHITPREMWEKAQTEGVYAPPTLESKGFIHFSTAQQVARIANNFYQGQTDLVLLVVDIKKLTAKLRFEPPQHPAGGELPPTKGTNVLFPHLYGALNLDAVVRAVDFIPNVDGLFALPEDI